MLRSEPELSLKTADINGYVLHYAEHGEGAPLLLVHGSLCDSRYWKSQLQPLGKSFHVYALSLRRYWPERWNGEGGGFSIEQHVADFVDQTGYVNEYVLAGGCVVDETKAFGFIEEFYCSC